MRLKKLNQCDISAGEFEACLDLSFHLCINLRSLFRHPDTEESILFSPAATEFHQSSPIPFEDPI